VLGFVCVDGRIAIGIPFRFRSSYNRFNRESLDFWIGEWKIWTCRPKIWTCRPRLGLQIGATKINQV
jgi:hypothetical protein